MPCRPPVALSAAWSSPEEAESLHLISGLAGWDSDQCTGLAQSRSRRSPRAGKAAALASKQGPNPPLRLQPGVAAQFAHASFAWQRASSDLTWEQQGPSARQSSDVQQARPSEGGGGGLTGGDSLRVMHLEGSATHTQAVPRVPTVLCDLRVSLPKFGLTSIVGEVGSGKSSLLLALMGELNQVDGRMAVASEYLEGAGVLQGTAYVSQHPFLMAGSIRDNVRMGLPYDPELLQQVWPRVQP